MTLLTRTNLKRIAAIVLAIILAILVFAFFLGKKYQADIDRLSVQKAENINTQRQKENLVLSARIKEREQQIEEIHGRELILEEQLKKRSKEYVIINKKYDRKADSIITLPMDAKVEFLSKWLSEADSTRWRHSSSNN